MVLVTFLVASYPSLSFAEEGQKQNSAPKVTEVNERNPFRFQGTVLDPIIRSQLDRIIKISKMTEVSFKDYPRRDNWDVEILPPHNAEELGFVPDEADRKRGFIAYSRPITDLVFPYSKPQKRSEAFSLVAARGEYEPFTLCVYNLGKTQPYSVARITFNS